MTRASKPSLHGQDPGLGGLLVHLPQYGVVICKSCRFAIQPSALSSHLQNHHILRTERRSILAQLSSLQLPPPDQVGIPASDSERISDLPILSGHKCDTSECNYACTSLKRMCQHWSEVHDEPNSKAIKIRSALLQTFFRGNKIRYFEVEGPPDSQCWTQKESQAAVSGPPTTSPFSAESFSTSTDEQQMLMFDEMAGPVIDYQALHYLHHYIRNSGFFLNRGNETTHFWIDTIVYEAYANPFLMNGILGMAAIDLARRSTDPTERRRHVHASASYRAGTLSGYRAAVAAPTVANSNGIVACSRLLGVQELINDMIAYHDSTRKFTVHDLIEHIVLLRGCSDLLIQLQPVLPADSLLRLPSNIETGLRQFEVTIEYSNDYDPSCLPADVWLILFTLEAKLTTAELLPEHEAPMIRNCINVLTRAAITMYRAQDDELDWAGWNAAEGWLRSRVVSDSLLPAMRDLRPAATVVFGSWVLLLLRKVEQRYAWMTGLSQWLISIATQTSPGTQVEDLLREIYKMD